LLGGISRTTLWEIRDVKGLIKSGYLYPGSRVRRTTARQLQDYINYLSTPAATQATDRDVDGERLDGLSERRRHRRRLA
jgi:hypothetical protein